MAWTVAQVVEGQAEKLEVDEEGVAVARLVFEDRHSTREGWEAMFAIDAVEADPNEKFSTLSSIAGLRVRITIEVDI